MSPESTGEADSAPEEPLSEFRLLVSPLQSGASLTRSQGPTNEAPNARNQRHFNLVAFEKSLAQLPRAGGWVGFDSSLSLSPTHSLLSTGTGCFPYALSALPLSPLKPPTHSLFHSTSFPTTLELSSTNHLDSPPPLPPHPQYALLHHPWTLCPRPCHRRQRRRRIHRQRSCLYHSSCTRPAKVCDESSTDLGLSLSLQQESDSLSGDGAYNVVNVATGRTLSFVRGDSTTDVFPQVNGAPLDIQVRSLSLCTALGATS